MPCTSALTCAVDSHETDAIYGKTETIRMNFEIMTMLSLTHSAYCAQLRVRRRNQASFYVRWGTKRDREGMKASWLLIILISVGGNFSSSYHFHSILDTFYAENLIFRRFANALLSRSSVHFTDVSKACNKSYWTSMKYARMQNKSASVWYRQDHD